MNILKNSKFYFSDLLELSTNERPAEKDLVLEKIDELSEKTSESISIQIPGEDNQASFEEISYMPLKNDWSKFLCKFMSTLSKHQKVYYYFTKLAILNQILKPKKNARRSKILSGQKLQRITNKSLLVSQNLNDSLTTDEEIPLSSRSNEEIKKSQSVCKSTILKPNYCTQKLKIDTLRSASSSTSGFRKSSSSGNNRMRALRKRMTLKSEDPQLIGIFKKISEDRIRVTPQDFKNFLNLRYPELVTEGILRFFNFKHWMYEDFIYELNRFIALGEERHLAFCFDIFDFDMDKLITYKDTFKAMEIRTGNYYDSDLVLIREMFNLKKRGKIYQQGGRLLRRRSTFSLIKEKPNNTEKKSLEKPNGTRYQSQPRPKLEETPGINFKEFCIIKFYGRPQLIQDFLLYTCNYNFLQEKGYIEKAPVHSTKNSETIVIEMNLDPEVLERISKSEKYDYYCALDMAMGLFPKSKLEDLIKKFKYLQSSDKLKYAVITRKSMIEKLPDIIGYKNDYLSGRLYDYLSQGKDLTKAVFLMRIHSLISKSTTLIANKLAFDLYDFRNDERLTVDEIHKMHENLPAGSLVCCECEIMVDMFIQSIFERVREKLQFIDFAKFNEIVHISCLGIEFIDFFKESYEECFSRKSVYFESRVLADEEIKKV